MEHRKARRSFNEPGHAHFLTFSCYGRWPLLSKDRTRQWFVEAMEAVRQRHELALLGYVIMPEHAHALIVPRRDEYRMDRILSDLKRPVAWKAKQHLINTGQTEWLERLMVTEGGKGSFRFWLPGGGFDRSITIEKSIPEIIRYMHENPVRRELVKKPADWVWTSARFWEGIRPIPIEMDRLDLG